MDSNGRHRTTASTSSAPAASSSTPAVVPSSSSTSTFRRLPSLARPFRRNPDKDKEKDKIKEEPVPEDEPGSIQHQRTLLSRVLGEPSSAATSSAASVFQHNTNLSTSSSNRQVSLDEPTSTTTPIRTSPIPPTDPASVSTPPLSPFPPKGSMKEAMSTAMAPPIPVLSSQKKGDMEPITYPSHLAQRLPPDAGPSSNTSTPISSYAPSATNTPPVTVAWPRLGSRSRDYTLGTPIRLNNGGRMHETPSTTRGHTANGSAGDQIGPEPGPGGPPTGVPRRKESMVAQATEQARVNGSGGSNAIRDNKDSGNDTDSGVEGTTRRRANTKTNNESGLGSAIQITRDKEKDKEKENLPVSAEKEAHSRSRKVSRPAKTSTYISRPTLPNAPDMKPVSASPMYYSILPFHGRPPTQSLRAHTGTLVGDRIWFIGGVDAKHCWRGVAWYDTESHLWSTIETAGDTLPPLRAHTTTAVGTKLYIFGGGDGPQYTNETWTFDTVTHRFHKPNIDTPRENLPPPRRAHTTVLYRQYLVVFGGGNGQTALNDIWALDISDPTRLTWHEWTTHGNAPTRKGYHTSNLVGDKMIVFGGSDGHASFADVHVLDLRTLGWTTVVTEVKHNRLAHTSTQVGSYLFILGGHDGQSYVEDILLFNLVTLQWETKIAKGTAPPGRGYHVALLHDARIFISGGYNGVAVFDDLWSLDLGAAAYLPQVTTFQVDETRGMGRQEVQA